jgi:glycosyltransferase involved in cell wall biosynthesis
MKISIVVTVYNERYTVRELLRRVLAVPTPLHEIIIVDDGSTDGTRLLLKGLEEQFRKSAPAYPVRFFYKEENQGKSAALASAFKEVTGDIVIIQDADLEYDPQDYGRLIQPILDGKADAVYGSRFISQERNVPFFWHMVANKALTTLCNLLTNLYVTDVWTGFKAFKSEIVKNLPVTSRRFGFEPEITIKMSKLGFRIYEVSVKYNARGYAEGKKIGFLDSLAGLYTIFRTWLFSDLGEFAIEKAQWILNNANNYNRMIYEEYQDFLGNRVIEVGSASGNNAKFLLDREFLCLSEFIPGYAELLKHNYRDWQNIRVARLDITDLGSFTEDKKLIGTFDTVICLNVIEHIQDDRLTMKNLASLIKPGGTGIFIVPAHQWLYGSMDEAAGHFKRYEKQDFEALLSESGFEVVRCSHFNPLAVFGWWLNGKIIRRRSIPGFQVLLFDKLAFLIEWIKPMDLPFGISLLAIAKKKA